MKARYGWITAILSMALTWHLLIYFRNPDYISPASNERTLTIILIDGLSKKIFEEELSRNHLPAIAALMQQSLYIPNGISAFPTMTGYAFYPFITGADASESGIYGLRWFDKERTKGQLRNYVGRTNVQMNHDIHLHPLTVFELAGAAYTASINTYMNRGVKESVKTGFAHTTAKYEGKTWLTQLRSVPFVGKSIIKNHFQHESDVTDLALQQLNKNPKVQWITYASPDAYNHVNGTDSVYHYLLRHVDYEISRLLNHINKLNHTQRAIAVISDHGIQDVSNNLDVCSNLKAKTGISIERGKSAVLWSNDLTVPAENLRHLDAFFVINGNLSAYIYVLNESRKKADAPELESLKLKNGTTVNLPAEIVQLEGIALSIYRDLANREVVVLSKNGKARIGKCNNLFYYNIEWGEDPLAYSKDSALRSMIGNGLYTAEEWLKNSLNSQYPDAVYRFYQLMEKEKSGDILLTADEGYDLASNYEAIVGNYMGGHGGATRNIIAVPYLFYEPGKKQRTEQYKRAEDLGKMMMAYLTGSNQDLLMIRR